MILSGAEWIKLTKRPRALDPAVTPFSPAEATGAGAAAASPAAPPGAEDRHKGEKTHEYSDYSGVELMVCDGVCAATLSNESMKPSKLQQHDSWPDKPLDYFPALFLINQINQTYTGYTQYIYHLITQYINR